MPIGTFVADSATLVRAFVNNEHVVAMCSVGILIEVEIGEAEQSVNQGLEFHAF